MRVAKFADSRGADCYSIGLAWGSTMILPFDPRRSADSVARANLERRLRADKAVSALLEILDSTDDRPKPHVHELRPRRGR